MAQKQRQIFFNQGDDFVVGNVSNSVDSASSINSSIREIRFYRVFLRAFNSEICNKVIDLCYKQISQINGLAGKTLII